MKKKILTILNIIEFVSDLFDVDVVVPRPDDQTSFQHLRRQAKVPVEQVSCGQI